MKRKLFLISASFFMMTTLLFLISCTEDDVDSDSIQVTGIEFKPNYFMKNGDIVGIDADIAIQAMQSAGIEFTLSMSQSWQTAYNATLNGHNKALMTVAYSPERKDLFKWAGPLSQSIYGIFENGNSGIVYPLSIDDCKSLPQIAVVRQWLETITLEDMGLNNLVYFDTYKEALDAFMSGEVRFIASDFYHLIAELPS